MNRVMISATLLLAIAFCGCSKKQPALPVTQPANLDSVRTSHAIGTGTVAQYPYTDTFTGTLSVSFSYQFNNLDTNYAAYRFYVTHLAQNLLVFNASVPVPIMQSTLYDLTNQPDTGSLNSNNTFNGTLLVYNNFPVSDNGNQVLQATYVLLNNGRNLSVTWDDTYFPVPGVCDGGESKGQYSGTLR